MGLKRNHPFQELSKYKRILFQPISAGMYVSIYTQMYTHYITSWFLRLNLILSHFRIQSSTTFHAVSWRVSDPLNCSCSFSAFLTASRSLSPCVLRAQTGKENGNDNQWRFAETGVVIRNDSIVLSVVCYSCQTPACNRFPKIPLPVHHSVDCWDISSEYSSTIIWLGNSIPSCNWLPIPKR